MPRQLRIGYPGSAHIPQIGPSLSFGRGAVGETRIQAEAALPDGRRLFGVSTAYVNDPNNGGQAYSVDSATVALYHFDSTFNDAKTANQYNLSGSGVTFSDNTTWMASRSGKVARFGNVGNHLTATIPDSVLRPANSTGFTIEFQIYFRSVPNTGSLLYLFRLAQGAPPGDVSEWSVKYKAANAPHPQVYGPEGAVVLDSDGWNTKLTPNTWHLVKITAEFTGNYSDVTTVYVDDMTTPAASPQSCSHFLTPGADWILSMGDFDGDMDEVRISSVVR